MTLKCDQAPALASQPSVPFTSLSICQLPSSSGRSSRTRPAVVLAASQLPRSLKDSCHTGAPACSCATRSTCAPPPPH